MLRSKGLGRSCEAPAGAGRNEEHACNEHRCGRGGRHQRVGNVAGRRHKRTCQRNAAWVRRMRYAVSSATIVCSRQALPQHVPVMRAHLARERFLVFLRGVSGADVVAVCWVRLVVVMPTDCASAAVAVGATSRGLSDRDSRADASADMAVSMAVITEMRPSIKSRPNSFMDFLAAKGRVA